MKDDGEDTLARRVEDLYYRHRRLVSDVVQSRLGWHRQDAEDIEQEVWFAVLRGIPLFRHQSQPKTWLRRIATNATLMWLRRESYRRHVSLEDWIATSPVRPPEERLEIETALGGLSALQRTIVLWHDIYGVPHAEIARWLGIARCTSSRHLVKARHILRDRLSTVLPMTEPGRAG